MTDEKRKLGAGLAYPDQSDQLSDEDMRMLSAYFDGELSEARSAQIRQRLQANDPAYLSCVQNLRQVRTELRDWHRRELQKAETAQAGKLDLWSRLEPMLQAEAKELQANPVRTRSQLRSQPYSQRWTSRTWDRLKNLSNGAPVFGIPRSFAMGFVSAVVLIFAVTSVRHIQEDERLSSIAGSELPRLSATRLQRVGLNDGRLNVGLGGVPVVTASGRPIQPMLLVSERAAQDYRQRLQVPLSRVIDQRFVLNGVRTDGADIDWLASDNSVDIVSTRNHADVPVIWVARKSR